MSSPIYIGTRGWDDPAWQMSFYPDSLPADWRFCYYSNRLRSLLLPAAIWPQVDAAQVAQWVEDSDPEFAIAVEVPPTLLDAADAAATEAFLDLTARLVPQVVGWVLCPQAPFTLAAWSSVAERLAPIAPLCLDGLAQAADPEVEAWRLAHDVGLCWRPAEQPAPAAGGKFLVCLAAEGSARGQRQLLEQLHAWQADGGRAGLYFSGPAAPAQAQQARLLADMMGV